MTITLHPKKIHSITGPLTNLLASSLLPKYTEIYVYNPLGMKLYIPRITESISKVKFDNAHRYEHDKVEYNIDHLELIEKEEILLNDHKYSIYSFTQISDLIDKINGLVIYVGNPTCMDLYIMRKYAMTVIVCCDEILDFEFYDFCYSTTYSTENNKKTEIKGLVNIQKPYTTDLYTITCSDKLSIDLFRIPGMYDDENPTDDIY